MYNLVNMEQVEWASRECHRQRTSPKRVPDLLDALNYAKGLRNRNFDTGAGIENIDILVIGRLVEPHKNAGGLRQVPVYVGYKEKMDWSIVPHALSRLLEAQHDLTPDEFFFEYEDIHPFVDGNGRSGSVLWNYLSGTLDRPQDAPWHESWGNDPINLRDDWS